MEGSQDCSCSEAAVTWKPTPVKTEPGTAARYYIQFDSGDWATVFLDDSSISVMSTWGNYGAFFGSLPPGTLKSFIIKRLEPDPRYAAEKFGYKRSDQYDGEETERKVRQYVNDSKGKIPRVVYQEELERLEDFDFEDYTDFVRWHWSQEISSEAWSCLTYRIPHTLVAMCENVLPALVEMLGCER